jgi:hypothetical protein
MQPSKNLGQQPGMPHPHQNVGRKHLEFELEPDTLRKVEVLARQSNCTPFEMCVTFLQERISFSDEP